MWLCVDYRTGRWIGKRTGGTGRRTEWGSSIPAAPSLSAGAPSSRRIVSWHLQLKYKINSS